MINGQFSGHRRKIAAERPEAAKTVRLAAKKKNDLSSFHSEKRGSVTRVILKEEA